MVWLSVLRFIGPFGAAQRCSEFGPRITWLYLSQEHVTQNKLTLIYEILSDLSHTIKPSRINQE